VEQFVQLFTIHIVSKHAVQSMQLYRKCMSSLHYNLSDLLSEVTVSSYVFFQKYTYKSRS